MKVLHLTLKKKWFDLILSGEKKEEYREIKPYWWTRLVQCGQIYDMDDFDNDGSKLRPIEKWEMKMSKSYDTVQFRNGYSPKNPVMELECLSIEIGTSKSHLCDEGEQRVFVIKLGKLLNHKNI